MVEKVKYFLYNDNEREEIASKALNRSIKDHSLELRFKQIFESIEFIKNK
jgi:spore maturation protein CgeB